MGVYQKEGAGRGCLLGLRPFSFEWVCTLVSGVVSMATRRLQLVVLTVMFPAALLRIRLDHE